MGSGAGDKLARGAVKAQFPSSSGVSDTKWNDAFADFDPAAYKANEDAKEVNREKLLAFREVAGDVDLSTMREMTNEELDAAVAEIRRRDSGTEKA